MTVYVGGQGMPEPTAPEKAPYATNQQLGENEVAHSGLTFVAVDGQRKAVLNLHRRSSNSSSSLRLIPTILSVHTTYYTSAYVEYARGKLLHFRLNFGRGSLRIYRYMVPLFSILQGSALSCPFKTCLQFVYVMYLRAL